MAATLESLTDLQSWEGYRSFMKERLKTAPAQGCPFFLSKEKIDFEVDGKPWKGFAVLAGPKGLLAVNKIKKEGVLFREAVSQLNGKEFTVEGFSPLQLKQAHLTLKKLKLGYSVSGAEEEGGSDEEGPETDELKERLDEIVAEIKKSAALKDPKATSFLKEAAGLAGQADKVLSKEPARARTFLDQAQALLDRAKGAAAAGGGEDSELGEIRTRRQAVIDAIKDAAKLREPANDSILKEAATRTKSLESALAKRDVRTADKELSEIEDLMTQVVEGADEQDDGDPDLAGLGDWKAYRAFIKAQLKRMPAEGGLFYVSRKKVEFDIEGKPYKEYAVLLGKESKLKPTVLALKKEGTLLFEGSVVPDGKKLTVNGVKNELVKGAIKLFIKLRLGYKIVAGKLAPDEDAAEAGDQAAPAAATAARGVDTVRQGILSATASWQQVATTVDSQVASLRATLKSSGDSDLAKIADSGLDGLTDQPRRPLMDAIRELQHSSGPGLSSAVAKTRKALSDYLKYIEQDPRIKACDQNPFGVSLKIRDTLAPALARLDRALATAPTNG